MAALNLARNAVENPSPTNVEANRVPRKAAGCCTFFYLALDFRVKRFHMREKALGAQIETFNCPGCTRTYLHKTLTQNLISTSAPRKFASFCPKRTKMTSAAEIVANCTSAVNSGHAHESVKDASALVSALLLLVMIMCSMNLAHYLHRRNFTYFGETAIYILFG